MKYGIVFVTLLLLCIPLLVPFFSVGLPAGDDSAWSVIRLSELHRELRDMQIPPRWSTYLNHGFGYPLFFYTYTLPFYIGEFFHLVGFGVVVSTKVTFIISILGAAFAMFLLAREFWGIKGGIIAAVLYSYAPYHVVDLFYRGSIGEALAFVFLPLLLLVYYRLIERPNLNYLTLSALLTAGLVLNHNATALLFFPCLLFWISLWMYKKKLSRDFLITIGAALGLGLGLSAFFWLPAMLEKKYILLAQIPLADKSLHVLNLAQIFGLNLHNAQLPYQFPLASAVLALLGILVTVRQKRYRLCVFTAMALIVSIYLLLPQSLLIWELPFLKEIDFPWRMFMLVSLAGSFITGALGAIKQIKLLIVIMLLIIIALQGHLIRSEPRIIQPDSYFETNDASTTSADELRPIWAESMIGRRPEKLIPEPTVIVSDTKITSNRITAIITAPAETEIILNQLYFPHWQAYLDGQPISLTPSPKYGLIRLQLPAGENQHLILQFGRTPFVWLADSITAISILGLGGIWILKRYFHF